MRGNSVFKFLSYPPSDKGGNSDFIFKLSSFGYGCNLVFKFLSYPPSDKGGNSDFIFKLSSFG
jgi:hypothetical protein